MKRGFAAHASLKARAPSLHHQRASPMLYAMGKKGWHDRGYIPHFDGHGISQHVVFRLHDSVPPGEREGDDVLERGYGASFLKDPSLAKIVVDALLHGHPDRYHLQAWCVMPNHVHVLVFTHAKHELGAIVRLWKSYTAARINKALGRRGPLWSRDYFDRFIRDEKHFQNDKRYIEMNPVAAGLCDKPEAWPLLLRQLQAPCVARTEREPTALT